MDPGTAEAIRFGVFELDTTTLELARAGRRCRLRPQAARALLYLARRPGVAVTREELIEHLWAEGTFVDANAGLNAALRRIRRALGDDARAPRYVETLPRIGYRFIAPLRPETGEHAAAAPPDAASRGDAAPAPPAAAAPRRRRFKIATLVAAGIVATLGLAALSGYSIARAPHGAALRPAGGEPPARERTALALTRLDNAGGREVDEWIGVALGEMLATELALGERLRVIDAARWGEPLGAADLARLRDHLGGDFVLSGSFTTVDEEEGRSVLIDLGLQDAISGETLIRIADRGRDVDLFELAARTGVRLRQRLGIGRAGDALADSARAGLPPDRASARLYALGLAKLRRLELPEACELLGRAAERAPAAAKVHAALTDCWAGQGFEDRAEAAARRAYELAGALPREDRLLIEGRYHEANRRFAAARDLYQALWTVLPDTPEHGFRLARMEIAIGRPEQALAVLETLARDADLEGDPRVPLVAAEAARARGDLDRQAAEAAKAAELGARLGASTLLAQARLHQAEALHHLGKTERAAALAREAREILTAEGDRRRLADALIHRLDSRVAEDIGLGLTFEEALAIYRQAGDRLGVGRTLVRLGRNTIAEADRAAAYFAEALATSRELANRRLEAEVLNGMAILAHSQLDPELAVARFEAAAAKARESGDLVLEAGILANLAGELIGTDALARAREPAERAVAIARKVGSRFLFALALIKSAFVAEAEGELDASESRLREALEVGRAIGDRRLEGMAQAWLGRISMARAEAAAESLLEANVRHWRAYGSPTTADWSALGLVELRRERGELDAAESLAREVLARADEDALQQLAARAYLGLVLADRGAVAEAREVLAALPDPASADLCRQQRFVILRARAHVELASGRLEEAGRTLQRWRRDAGGATVAERFAMRLLEGRLLLLTGELERGQTQLERLSEDARRLGYLRFARLAAADLPGA